MGFVDRQAVGRSIVGKAQYRNTGTQHDPLYTGLLSSFQYIPGTLDIHLEEHPFGRCNRSVQRCEVHNHLHASHCRPDTGSIQNICPNVSDASRSWRFVEGLNLMSALDKCCEYVAAEPATGTRQEDAAHSGSSKALATRARNAAVPCSQTGDMSAARAAAGE